VNATPKKPGRGRAGRRNLCSTAEDGADFAAKAIARGGELVFAFGPETIEKIETHLSIEDGRADGLKREELACLLFQLFNSLPAGLGNRLESDEGEMFGIEFGEGKGKRCGGNRSGGRDRENLLGSNISRRTQ